MADPALQGTTFVTAWAIIGERTLRTESVALKEAKGLTHYNEYFLSQRAVRRNPSVVYKHLQPKQENQVVALQINPGEPLIDNIFVISHSNKQ